MQQCVDDPLPIAAVLAVARVAHDGRGGEDEETAETKNGQESHTKGNSKISSRIQEE